MTTSQDTGDGSEGAKGGPVANLPGVSTDAHIAFAANLLVRSGAQFLRDNPDGPIRMTIEISRVEVDYDVLESRR